MAQRTPRYSRAFAFGRARITGPLLCALMAFACPLVAAAQFPPRADALSSQVIGDSQRVLRELDATLRRNQRDAGAWHRRGMIAWLLADAAGAPSGKGINAIGMRRLADTSFRIAAEIERDSARYQLAAGMFLRLSPEATARLAAVGYLNAAIEAARRSDTAFVAVAALEAGRVHWLRYDTQAHQMPVRCSAAPPSVDSASTWRPTAGSDAEYLPTEIALKALHNALLECHPPPPSMGEADYRQAEIFFREAYDAAPQADRPFRQLSMLLAEKNRWTELASVARDRINRKPADAWAWLTLATTSHRTKTPVHAKAAFDTALSFVDPAERGRLFAFQRMLNRPDSIAFTRANATTREEWERTFWGMSAPLWSREGTDPRTEFLSRVTLAELLWTVEELGVRGADSDRGEAFIRYGPPDRIFATRGTPPGLPYLARVPREGLPGDTNWTEATPQTALIPLRSDVVTFWDYDNGLTLPFWGPPTYGTAYFPRSDLKHVDRVVELRAAAFDNIVTAKLFDIPLSLTRFRAAGDSVDVLAISRAPMDSLRASAANAPVTAHRWMHGDNEQGYYDSSLVVGGGLHRDVYRVAPARFMYRIEASAAGESVAARAIRWIIAGRDSATGFDVRGFGVSDVLLATAAQPRIAVPSRWRDFNVAPLVDGVARQAKLDLIWEMYELGNRGGRSQYTVTVTIQRRRSAAGRLAAAIVGFAAEALRIDRQSDRVTAMFDRTIIAAPAAIVDHVSMELRDTPRGEYRLTIQVTDRISGRRASTSSAFTIR
jgi:GWxTD domain-containing protein